MPVAILLQGSSDHSTPHFSLPPALAPLCGRRGANRRGALAPRSVSGGRVGVGPPLAAVHSTQLPTVLALPLLT